MASRRYRVSPICDRDPALWDNVGSDFFARSPEPTMLLLSSVIFSCWFLSSACPAAVTSRPSLPGLVLVLDFSSWQGHTSPVGRWVMRTAESSVDVLASGAGGADTSILSSQSLITTALLGLRRNRHGHCGSVDSPLSLGLGHPLHPVDAASRLRRL